MSYGSGLSCQNSEFPVLSLGASASFGWSVKLSPFRSEDWDNMEFCLELVAKNNQ